MLKLAICGKMRAGKDTVADYLIHNYDFSPTSFGGKIYTIVEMLYPEAFENGKPRAHLQGIGQKLREFDPDIWVNSCFNELKEDMTWRMMMNHPSVNYLITDLRQVNEYERCKSEGFTIVRVNCDTKKRIERCKQSDNFKYQDLLHETEMNVEGFKVDFEIENSGSLEELYEQVDAVITYLTQK